MPEILKKLLTERLLASLKPLRPSDAGYRRPIWDIAMPGLCVRVGKHVEFYVVKHLKGSTKTRWVRLGTHPVLTLKEARRRAAQVLVALEEGSPVPTLHRNSAVTFAEAVDFYREEALSGKRTRTEISAILDRAAAAFGDRPVASLGHEDFVAYLQGIAGRTKRNPSGSKILSGGPHAAVKARAILGPLFKWLAFRRIGGVTANPVAAIPNRNCCADVSSTRSATT
jgi:hypothetical protein